MSHAPPKRLEALRLRLDAERLPDPAALLAGPDADEAFLWQRPAEACDILGLGVAHAIEVAGPERFRDAEVQARALLAGLSLRGDVAASDVGPLLVGGFAFGDHRPADPAWQGFPAGRLVLPRLLLVRRGGRAWATLVAPEGELVRAEAELRARLASASASGSRGPGAPAGSAAPIPEYRAVADAPHAQFRERIEQALAAIGRGDLEKLVVARSVRLLHPDALEPAPLLEQLRQHHPSATTFAVRRGDATFLGATPERLVRMRGGRVEASAVAGSAPRGRTPEEDAHHARALHESKKEQTEHAVVVRAIREALAERCAELEVSEAPRLLALEGIQHLETLLCGSVPPEDRTARSVLHWVGRLHPTPAVGGAPREAALAWLARYEDLERGWYAAPLGWLDAAGDGEFVVALRCALLRRGEARLFAGAGIVEGSDPEAELLETRLKLKALLGPLLEI